MHHRVLPAVRVVLGSLLVAAAAVTCYADGWLLSILNKTFGRRSSGIGGGADVGFNSMVNQLPTLLIHGAGSVCALLLTIAALAAAITARWPKAAAAGLLVAVALDTLALLWIAAVFPLLDNSGIWQEIGDDLRASTPFKALLILLAIRTTLTLGYTFSRPQNNEGAPGS